MKKLIRNAYIVAFFISVFLFIAGIMVGYFIQKSVYQRTEEKLEKLESRIEDIQLQYIYLNTIGESDCNFGSVLLDDATKELWSISKELTTIESHTSKEDMKNLEKKYFLLSAKSWILNSYLNKNCKIDSLAILYFYSVPCDNCEKQGNILDSIQNSDIKNRIRVFVMNINSEEKIVESIKKTYNISQTPTIIIGQNKYEGLINEEGLKKIITQSLNNV